MCVCGGGVFLTTVRVWRSGDNVESVLSVFKVGPKACQQVLFFTIISGMNPKPLILGNLIDSVTPFLVTG